jgi:hypothetical protein
MGSALRLIAGFVQTLLLFPVVMVVQKVRSLRLAYPMGWPSVPKLAPGRTRQLLAVMVPQMHQLRAVMAPQMHQLRAVMVPQMRQLRAVMVLQTRRWTVLKARQRHQALVPMLQKQQVVMVLQMRLTVVALRMPGLVACPCQTPPSL